MGSHFDSPGFVSGIMRELSLVNVDSSAVASFFLESSLAQRLKWVKAKAAVVTGVERVLGFCPQGKGGRSDTEYESCSSLKK